MNPSEQHAARVQALESIASIICESSIRETTYRRQYEQSQTGRSQQRQALSAHTKYRTAITDLYKEILMFQATNICFLSDPWAKQTLKDFARWDDWEKTMESIEGMNTNLRHLDAQWSQLRQQEQWELRQSGHEDNLRIADAMKSEMERIARAITSSQDNADRRSILDWLHREGANINPATFRNVHAKPASVDTGGWILKNEDFMAWKASRNSFLWLHGKGKYQGRGLCCFIGRNFR